MVVAVVLLELLDDRVKRPEDVEEVMQVATFRNCSRFG